MLNAVCKAVLPHSGAWTLRMCEDLRDRLVRLLGEADAAPCGGRITDELRSGVANYQFRDNRDFALFEGIADRIDAAHEEALASVMNDALYHANDKDMAEHGWVRWPFRIGDHVEDLAGHRGTVKGMTIKSYMDESTKPTVGVTTLVLFEFDDVYHTHIWREADTLKVIKQPTVEDVLREFTDAILEWSKKSGTIDETGTWSEVAAEYAPKLRLAGDAE